MTTKSTDQIVSFAKDKRGYLPYALIGALVLLASTMLIVSMESQEEPEPEIDESLAVDRTLPAAQSALRSATLDGTQKASDAPITDTADTPLGNALDDISASDELFENYVKLWIYLEAQNQLPEAGQEIRSDTETNVSLPELDPEDKDDVKDKLDRVDLTIGHQSSQLDYGKLEVTIEDVEIEVEHEGEVVYTRTDDITATSATTAFELHDRTEEFEELLNTGFFEESFTDFDGLGRNMAARLYPLAWTKSYIKYAAGPKKQSKNEKFDFFQKILPNDQTELAANHAVYGVQENAFGASDPYSTRAMKSAIACYLIEVGENLVEDNYDYDNDFSEEICEYGVRAIFGGVMGDQPEEAPTMTDLLTEALDRSDTMDQEEEFTLDRPAGMSFFHAKGEDEFEDLSDWLSFADDTDHDFEGEDFFDDSISDAEDIADAVGDGYIENIVEEVYAAEIRVDGGETDFQDGDSDFDGPSDMPFCDPVSNCNTDTEVTDVSTDIDIEFDWEYQSESGLDQDYWDVEIDVEQTITEEKEIWNQSGPGQDTQTDTYIKEDSFDAEVGGTIAPGLVDDLEDALEVEEIESSNQYDLAFELEEVEDIDDGNIAPPGSTAGTSFDDIPEETLEDAFTAITNAGGTIEDQFVQAIENLAAFDDTDTDSTMSDGDLDTALGYTDPSPPDILDDYVDASDTEIENWLEDELAEMLGIEEGSSGYDPGSLLADHESTDPDYVEPGTAEHIEIISEGGTGWDELGDNLFDTDEDADQLVYWDYPGTSPNSYENLHELSRTATYQLWVDRTYFYIQELEELMDTVQDDIEEDLGDSMGAGNSWLNDALDGVQDFIDGDVPEHGAELDGSPLLDEVTFDVHGSPTYLSLDVTERDTVAPVRQAEGDRHHRLEGAHRHSPPPNTNHSALAASHTNYLPYPGVPVLPPTPWTPWILSFSVWDVEVKGEYARFEVSAGTGDPQESVPTTYVREERPVNLSIYDEEYEVGEVDPINFDSNTVVVVIVPGKKPGVGDDALLDGDVDMHECSLTWDEQGPNFEESDRAEFDDISETYDDFYGEYGNTTDSNFQDWADEEVDLDPCDGLLPFELDPLDLIGL